jgi:tRNA U34 5-carboxymethylaminomethyl modifying GTPase MnmE/TrmE
LVQTAQVTRLDQLLRKRLAPWRLPLAIHDPGQDNFWHTVRFPQADIDALRATLTAKIDAELGGTSKQVPAQKRRIAALEKERKKLLQAFYAEAIPKELLKEEQERITREIAQAQQLVEDHDLKAERATSSRKTY